MDPHAAPYHARLAAIEAAHAAQVALMDRHRSLYDAWYSRPLSRLDETRRAEFHPEAAAAVRKVEAGTATVGAERDVLFRDLVECILSKAAALGTSSARDGRAGPTWVHALADLHSLRTWRATELDGRQVHMAPLFLRNPKLSRKQDGPLFDRCVRTWAKAAGMDADAVRDRIAELADAGLLPGVEPVPGADWEVRLAALIEREGASSLASEIEAASEILDPEVHPLPEEAMASLRQIPTP